MCVCAFNCISSQTAINAANGYSILEGQSGEESFPVCRAHLLVSVLRPDSGVCIPERSPEFFVLCPISVQCVISLRDMRLCALPPLVICPCPRTASVLSDVVAVGLLQPTPGLVISVLKAGTSAFRQL